MTDELSPCCWLDQNRICQSDCMAFMVHESDAANPSAPKLLKCAVLDGLNDLAQIRRHLTGQKETVRVHPDTPDAMEPRQ